MSIPSGGTHPILPLGDTHESVIPHSEVVRRVMLDEQESSSTLTSNSHCSDNMSLHDLVRSHLSTTKPSIPLQNALSCVCRICLSNDDHQEPLVSPCLCKGTLRLVHLSCLERWLNQNRQTHCELCLFQFTVQQTPRYGISEGLRMWFFHSNSRRQVQVDFLIGVLLTFISVGLILVTTLGLQYFVEEGKRVGISQMWSAGMIGFLLALLFIGYVITVYLIFKDQVNRWRRWWQESTYLRIIASPVLSQQSNC